MPFPPLSMIYLIYINSCVLPLCRGRIYILSLHIKYKQSWLSGRTEGHLTTFSPASWGIDDGFRPHSGEFDQIFDDRSWN
jgi:hypothetical protein